MLISILFIYLTIDARDFSKEGTKEALLLRFTITSKGSMKKDPENPSWELAVMCSILDCYWDAPQISDHILGVPNLMVDLVNIRTDKLPALRGRKTCQTFRHVHTHTHTRMPVWVHTDKKAVVPGRENITSGYPKATIQRTLFLQLFSS